MATYTAKELADRVGGALTGPGDLRITGVERLDRAAAGQLTFIGHDRFADAWTASAASAVLVSDKITVPDDPRRAVIRVPDADLAMAQVLALFAPPLPKPEPGVAASACVHPTAAVGKNAGIGAGCYVGPRTTIGDDCIIHPNVTILDDCRIGAGCTLWPGVVIRERCELGEGCILHPNVVVGADGFGYRAGPRGPVKIPQIGSVILGREVELGAGTCVDRGKFSATVIGDFTKIDNMCQIAHNCRIGRGCIIAGQSGIAGSATLGDGVMIGGRVAVKDHVTIGDRAQIGGSAAVMDNVPAGEAWAGYPARPARQALREHAAMRKLPDLVKLLGRK